MISNYVRVTARNLWRERTYTIINVAGLAVGISICLLVAMFVEHEFQYDRHFKDYDRIYRVIRERNPSGHRFMPLGLQGPVGPALVEEIPGIDSATRFFNREMWAGDGEHGFTVRGVVGDSHFLTFFGHNILHGDGPEALAHPDVVYITDAFARKMFPGGDAVPGEFLEPAALLHYVRFDV